MKKKISSSLPSSAPIFYSRLCAQKSLGRMGKQRRRTFTRCSTPLLSTGAGPPREWGIQGREAGNSGLSCCRGCKRLCAVLGARRCSQLPAGNTGHLGRDLSRLSLTLPAGPVETVSLPGLPQAAFWMQEPFPRRVTFPHPSCSLFILRWCFPTHAGMT